MYAGTAALTGLRISCCLGAFLSLESQKQDVCVHARTRTSSDKCLHARLCLLGLTRMSRSEQFSLTPGPHRVGGWRSWDWEGFHGDGLLRWLSGDEDGGAGVYIFSRESIGGIVSPAKLAG